MLAHHAVVAHVARVADPNRKGVVERAIQHTQDTGLKGRRFESIEQQNEWLSHWEERWAAPRIHGRKKRQVLAMYLEEKPYLRPLPLEPFRHFRQETRTVDDTGMVPVDASHYAALPAPLYSEVTVRIYEREIEIFAADGELLRRHEKSDRKGAYVLLEEDRRSTLTWCRSVVNRFFLSAFAALRTRSSALCASVRLCVRDTFCLLVFPSIGSLPSTTSATCP